MDPIKISNQNTLVDNYVTVNLSSMFDIDKSRDIDLFVNKTTLSSINPVVDVETTIYRPSYSVELVPYFINTGATPSYTDNLLDQLFTVSDAVNYDEAFIKSFYLLEFFDSADKNTQSLVFDIRKYIRPQVTNGTVTGATSTIDFSKVNILVPNNLVLTNNLLYLRVRFFCAKTGLLYLFKTTNLSIFSDADVYVPILIDKGSVVWSFNTSVSSLYQYNNPFIQAQVDNSGATNKQQVNNNTSKGDFINIDGRYQSGSVVNNDAC